MRLTGVLCCCVLNRLLSKITKKLDTNVKKFSVKDVILYNRLSQCVILFSLELAAYQ